MTTSHLGNGQHSQTPARPMAPPIASTMIVSTMRGEAFGGEADRAKMEAFRKIKPTCVSLMGIAASPPTSYSAHAGLIDTLNAALSTVPQSAFTPNMINYVLFPVTQILRHHDPLALPDLFLESTFCLLSLVVGVWKAQPGGMDIGAWEQLWKFTTSSIAPRVVDGGKGKGKELGQEVQLQAVLFLSALLLPSTNHPSPAMLEKVSSPKSPLMPTLFQTITLLLAVISPSPPHSTLQLASLKLLRSVLTTYLQGQHPVLAAVLPGTISSVSKLFGLGAALKGEVASQAAGLAEAVIVATLADEDLQRLGILRSGLDDLEDLADDCEARSEVPPSPTPSTSTLGGGKDPFPPLSKSYLDFTSAQLFTTLRPILSALASHPSHLARTAAASLSFALLDQCRLSLPQLIPFSLSTLLRLSRDDFDPVRITARSHLSTLLSTNNDLEPALVDLLGEAMSALPRLIVSHSDTKVAEAASLLTAIADSTLAISGLNPIVDLLGPRGKVERWGWALLDCLEFGRPAGWSAMGTSAARAAEKGWKGGLLGSSLPLLLEGSAPGNQAFPELPLRYIDSENTIKAVKQALNSLGSAGGEVALYAVEYFLLLAKAKRVENTAKAVSALWVAQLLLDGIARGQEEGPEGKIGKATRKMAREMTRVIVAMDEAEDDEEEADMPAEEEEVSDALTPVERTKGLDVVTVLLDRPSKSDTHAAKETRRLHAQAQRALLTSISLSTLATTSRILSSSFRPLLLTVLYTILAQLASPHAIVNTFAEAALGQIAYNTGYASVQNLILDNVDYVINVVSQRLTPARLSPTAPLVLIAMIRLTRSEIVPLVHDVVDEIFDALDDYHGYEVLASGLLAVLVTLVDIMADDVSSQEISEERKAKLAEFDRLGKLPNPAEDFAKFGEWFAEREKNRSKDVEEILSRAPEHAWGKNAPDAEGQPEQEQDTPMDEPEPKATRSQEITTQILDKSLNFLSHRSPFLRARILSLISSAIPVLASGNREVDLLPLIDRSWGIILKRLDDPYPYVVTEAAEVVAGLCRHVGDFMSRRILDHAWPRLKRLLAGQQALDARAALARKGAVGTTSQWTVSHRLHVAILVIAEYVVREVPVDDAVLWDMMVLFRACLDKRAHEEVQGRALGVYRALGRRDGDALWVVLRSTIGDGSGVWGYLREEGLDVRENVESILHEI